MAQSLLERVTEDRYSRKKLALLMGVSTQSVWRWMRAGRIAYDLKEGHRFFFSEAEVLRFLREDYLALEPKAGA